VVVRHDLLEGESDKFVGVESAGKGRGRGAGTGRIHVVSQPTDTSECQSQRQEVGFCFWGRLSSILTNACSL
jgi:hypothetical protein